MLDKFFCVLMLLTTMFSCFANSAKGPELIDAVRESNLAKVENLIRQGADVNFQLHGTTGSPLAFALENRDFKIAQFLVNKGANVDGKTADGFTFLTKVCMIGDIELTTFLVRNGAQINVSGSLGTTPLILSAYGTALNKFDPRFVDLVRLLLEKGADVSLADDQGYAPIHYAATKARYPIIDVLLAHGADINRRANDGRTPLYYAIVDPNPRLLKFLLDRGADPNIVMHNREHNGLSYLQIAKKLGNSEIIDLLKGAGALEFVQDDWESTE